MQKSQRIIAFSTLGHNLESFVKNYADENKNESQLEFNQTLNLAQAKNGWFTIENQLYAISSWAKALQKDKLEKWINAYDLDENKPAKKIGIITAGNIPMVGFHDILSVLITGNKALVKLSSNDDVLIKYIIKLLIEIEPEFSKQIEFVEKLKGHEAVIATGSDNTARYFETYFKNIPNIIRKNRTSVAVLNGNESEENLKGLSNDILRHFGLGCRNVTKLFVPKGYDLDNVFKSLYPWSDIVNHHKYANNYDYHKAIYLMKGIKFVENGFVIIKQDDALFSPISSVFFEEYEDKKEVETFLENHTEQIQCIVGNDEKMIPFGKAQEPELWDYADNVDTIEWINSLK